FLVNTAILARRAVSELLRERNRYANYRNDNSGMQCIAGAYSVGRLGCSFENQPYVVPINFAYDSGYLYVFSTFGQKVKWMRANPKVCVQTDQIEDQGDWISVIVNGQYEEFPEPQYTDERKHAGSLLAKRSHW